MTEALKNYDFNYLIDKITAASFQKDPFEHIYLEDFFSNEHLTEITKSYEIASVVAQNDQELIETLQEKGFEPIEFPGTVMTIDQYIAWHEKKEYGLYNDTCGGFGMTFRLKKTTTDIIKALNSFWLSQKFANAIADKFNINNDQFYFDGGIQKYLDGYEISPHTDIRRKAATFMVNINPSENCEFMNIHTHYLTFDEKRKYVQSFWEGNEEVDRCWVPWDWAVTSKQQSKNNTIVLFSPSNDTLHGVRADYDHLVAQRTQLYGNLWYSENPAKSRVGWEALDLIPKPSSPQLDSQPDAAIKNVDSYSARQLFASMLPAPVKSRIKRMFNMGG